MKLLSIAIFFVALWSCAHAQLVVPESPPARAIGDAAMLMQFGGQKIEVFPASRAVKSLNGQYTLVDASTSEALSKDRVGVGYSHASHSHVVLSGEISIKLKARYSVASLGPIASEVKLQMPPDLYLFTARTPLDLVRWVGWLQANPAVEWVEPFSVRARIN